MVSNKTNINYEIQTDEHLFKLFRNNDEEAFNEIVKRYKDKVIRFAYKYTNDEHDADDITQESFIRILKYKDKFDETMKFSSWFYSIINNVAISKVMSNNKYISFPIDEFNDAEIKEYELYECQEDEADFKEEEIKTESIKKAFDELGDTFKTAMLLRFDQELDYEEISEVLEIPVGTVKSKINRGRKQLIDKLKKTLYRE